MLIIIKMVKSQDFLTPIQLTQIKNLHNISIKYTIYKGKLTEFLKYLTRKIKQYGL